jgi:D-alanyl-D-alanine dipeptidase
MHLRTRAGAIAVASACAVGVLCAQAQAPAWPREAENPSAPKPLPPKADIAGIVGEYERAADAQHPPVQLIVFERGGVLWRIADRGPAQPLKKSATDVYTLMRGPGGMTGLGLSDGIYTRLQVGPENGGQLKVTPVAPVAGLLTAALSAAPPKETGTFTPADLVELTTLDPSIKLDVRYATTNNFLGSVFYAEPRAFLQRPAAQAVVRVQRKLKPLGYGVLIHDGYRPWYVTKTFWDATPAEKKWLVANPASGSKHNRGAAVDLSLIDLKTGAVIQMPSTYDESTDRAYAFYPGGTSLERWHRALLRRMMEAEGFTVNPEEWWHFDYKDWRNYAIGNVPFEKIH